MGKSTLCSAMVQDLRARGSHDSVVLFCPVDETRGKMDATQYVIRSLLYQFWNCHQLVRDRNLIKRMLLSVECSEAPMPMKEFQRKFRNLVTNIDEAVKVALVIDGLNGDSWTEAVIVNEIADSNSLRKAGNFLKCAIASRERSLKIGQYRDSLPVNSSHITAIEMDLAGERGAQAELLKFATSRLTHMAPAMPGRNREIENWAQQLCLRTNWNFLRLSLAFEDIYRTGYPTGLDLSKAIDSLPSTNEDIYQKYLESIRSQDIDMAQGVFAWLTVGRRLLRVSELHQALVIATDTAQSTGHVPYVDGEELPSEFEQNIRRICGWLVVVDQGLVRFRHPSVMEYLLSEKRFKWSQHPVLDSHEFVARTCLKIIKSQKEKTVTWLRIGAQVSQHGGDHPPVGTLEEYAFANWPIHYRSAEAHSRTLAGLLQQTVCSSLDHTCQQDQRHSSARVKPYASLILRLCAFHGFETLLKLYLETGTSPDCESSSQCPSPLTIAVSRGHFEVVSLLLQYGASINRGEHELKRPILHLAVAQGSPRLLELIITYGARLDAVQSISGKTALHIAAEHGHSKIVEMLLEYNDMNVNAKMSATGESPMHLAAKQGHIEAIKSLLQSRHPSAEEISCYNSIVQQPWYGTWAQDFIRSRRNTRRLKSELARRRASRQIKELISLSRRSIDVDQRSKEGWTPLHVAAFNGHEAVVELLIHASASIKSVTNSQRTALYLAAEQGHLETVKYLLTAGADVHAAGGNIGTLCEDLIHNGCYPVADLLLWQSFCSGFTPTRKTRQSVLSPATRGVSLTRRDQISRDEDTRRPATRAARKRFPLRDLDCQISFPTGICDRNNRRGAIQK